GDDSWNYQVKDLAETVAMVIPGVEISINKNAQPDKRSYRVSFEKFKELAPGYTPEVDLFTAITELRDGLSRVILRDEDFRQSKFIRLNVLAHLKKQGMLTDNLEWASDTQLPKATS